MAEETDDDVPFSNEANKNSEDNSLDHHPTIKHHAKKKVPHYLRASTGSCHDACKYGHPHKTKDKPIRPVRRRISTPLSDGEKMIDVQIFVDKKVQKAIQSKKLELPSAKESASSDKKSKKSIPSSFLESSPKVVKQEARSLTKSPSPKVPKVSNKVAQSSRKSTLPDTSIVSKQKAAKESVLPKRIPLNPKEKNVVEGDTNGRGRVKQSPLLDTLKKPNREIASTTTVKKGSSKQTPLVINSKERKVSEGNSKPSLSVRTSKVETKRVLHPTTEASKSLKLVGQRTRTRAQTEAKEPCSDMKVEEKTLHVIETKRVDDPFSVQSKAGLLIQSPSPLSPDSLNSSSQTDSLSFTSHEIEGQDDLDSEYTDISSADAKAAVVHDTKKLKLSKGKVVGRLSESETNKLKRLQFRQGRILDGDNNQGTNGGAQRMRYTKKAADSVKKEAENGVLKVVLKHQEMETKKDEQVSLNNVIEETASKLVEKRKSRVKALVGAFESVISLQERKPSVAVADR
ncbi:Calmodulin binding protein PICBP [Bienertia sinuspersici]